MTKPNLRIIGIEESEDSQLQEPVNIFNKILEENFPNLKKEMLVNIQEAYRTPNRLDQNRNSPSFVIVKTPNAQNKERILKAVRGKGQVTYKGRPIRITPDFSPETMKEDPGQMLYPQRTQIQVQCNITQLLKTITS